MPAYTISGAAGTASSTAATAGIVKVENAATLLSNPRVSSFALAPGAAAEDSNYTISLKRQTSSGTWTSVTPAPHDVASAAAKAVGGRASTAAGTAGTVLGYWGCNQRGGYRHVCVPGEEWVVDRVNSYGIILEYVFVQGTAINYGTLTFTE